MKKILLSAFAFAAMTSVAMAAPVQMTDAQMDAVTAGNTAFVSQFAAASATSIGGRNNVNVAVAVNVANITQVKGHDKKFDRKRPHKKKRF